MFRARYFFNALIFSSIAALTACGGGGGGGGHGGGNGGNGGGSSITDPTNTFFPTETNIVWTYNSGGSTATTRFTDDSVVKIGGVKTQVHALNYTATNGKEYYVTAANKISLQGLFIPQIITSSGTYQADGRFTDLLEILDTTATTTSSRGVNGRGKVKITGYDKRDMDYTGVVLYLGDENITTGGTTYSTKHISITLSLNTRVEGTDFSIPYNVEFWIADNVGIVKRVQDYATYTLSVKTP